MPLAAGAGSLDWGGERREFAFARQGRELGQGVDEAADVILHHGDQPIRHAPPLVARDSVDQCHQSGIEALRPGERCGIGHRNMLI